MDLQIFTLIWHLWLEIFAAIPFWNPYGAALALVVGVMLTGSALRAIFD